MSCTTDYTPKADATEKPAMIALCISVYNHPGVLTHISSLFARRAFNVEGIFAMPVGDTGTTTIWILAHNDERLQQMVRQTEKLRDVISLEVWEDGQEAFAQFAAYMGIWEKVRNKK